MGKSPNSFWLPRRLWLERRKPTMMVLALIALGFLDVKVAPSLLFPKLERFRPRTLVIHQGQEELNIEGISITKGSQVLSCERQKDLDIYLDFGSARLMPDSVTAEDFRISMGAAPPKSFDSIQYLSRGLDLPAGSVRCNTSFRFYADQAHENMQILRLSQPGSARSNFRLFDAQFTGSNLIARLQTAKPGSDGPGLGCSKILQIDRMPKAWKVAAPFTHNLEVSPKEGIVFRFEHLPTNPSTIKATNDSWPTCSLQMNARALRVVDLSGDRTTRLVKGVRGEATVRVARLSLKEDRMEVEIKGEGSIYGLRSIMEERLPYALLLLVMHGGMVTFVGISARSRLQRSPNPFLVQVFVGYSSEDSESLAKILNAVKGLEKEGFAFWWDKKLVPGTKWKTTIDKTIEVSDIALLLVSQSFLVSEHCIHEVQLAQAKEKILIPIVLSRCEWERHPWLSETHYFPGKGLNVKEHYDYPGGPEQLVLDIRGVLREHAENIRAARGAEPVQTGDPANAEARTEAEGSAESKAEESSFTEGEIHGHPISQEGTHPADP